MKDRLISRVIIQTNTFPEYLNLIQVDGFQFSGNRSLLKSEISFSNSHTEPIWVQDLEFVHPKENLSIGLPNKINVNIFLQPGETCNKKVQIRLSNSIPKGTYETLLKIGDKNYSGSFIIQDNFELYVFPKEFITQGIMPNHDYEFSFEIVNKGNVDYVIPKLNHSLMMDSQYECKAKSWCAMNDAKDGEQAFKDGYYKRVSEKYGFWVGCSIKETGEILKPGQKKKLHLIISIPENIDKNSCYSGEIVVVYNQLIKYKLIA